MKTNKVQTIRYSLICPHCKRVISGNSESATEYNLKVHIERKHEVKDAKTN
jgi:hypothetical protein